MTEENMQKPLYLVKEKEIIPYSGKILFAGHLPVRQRSATDMVEEQLSAISKYVFAVKGLPAIMPEVLLLLDLRYVYFL